MHLEERGFADIGYHFVIDYAGRLYEGRSLGVRGAHTSGHNTGAVGIVLLGNFEEIQPSAAQMAKLQALVKMLVTNYPIENLGGHLDFNPGITLCPGKNLEPLLPQVAAAVNVRFGA